MVGGVGGDEGIGEGLRKVGGEVGDKGGEVKGGEGDMGMGV